MQNTFPDYIIEVQENPFCICIVTPIMRRAHGLPLSRDIVFVDSSGSCDQGGSCVTFFFGVTKVGGIPLAVLIHKFTTKDDYASAFKFLRKSLGNFAFYGQMEPSIFMTDDSKSERQALNEIFPNSTLLLCTFHVLQALLRWLCESKHGVSKFERQLYMQRFRKVMYSPNEIEAKVMMDELCNDKSTLFSKHMMTYRNRMLEWCICYRNQFPTHGHNTNNIVEASIRVFKDIVLERCKAFNSAALVDFICKILEDYHKRRLIKFSSFRVTKFEIIFQNFCNKAKLLEVNQKNDTTYEINSSSGNNFYTVIKNDKLNFFCDCAFGQGGRFCKHICAVHLFGDTVSNLPNLTDSDRIQIGTLAVGNNFDHTFLHKMDMDTMETETECATLNNKENNSDNFNFHSSMQKCNMEIVVENDSNINNDNALTNSEMDIELELLTKNINNIKQIAKNNNNKFVLNKIKLLNKQLSEITTVSELSEISASVLRRGKVIGIQPTSRSRRISQITTGAKRIQAGRPSNSEMPSKKRRTKKRCLGENIKNNTPNAKSH